MDEIFTLLWPILITGSTMIGSSYWVSTRESSRYTRSRYFRKRLGRKDVYSEAPERMLKEEARNATFRLNHMEETFFLPVLDEEIIIHNGSSKYEATTLAEFLRNTKNSDCQRLNDTFGYCTLSELETSFVRKVWEGYRTMELNPRTKKLTPISKKAVIIKAPYLKTKEDLIREDEENTPTYNKSNIHSILNIPYMGIWDNSFHHWQESRGWEYTELDREMRVFPYKDNAPSRFLKVGDVLAELPDVKDLYDEQEWNQIKRAVLNEEETLHLKKIEPVVYEEEEDEPEDEYRIETGQMSFDPVLVGEDTIPGNTSAPPYSTHEHDRTFSNVPADQWQQVRSDYKEYLNKFSQYETDPWLALSYPAFNDVSVTNVSNMIKAMKSVERFFSFNELNGIDESIENHSGKLPERSVYREYSDAVDEFILAFKLAEKTARQIADTNMSKQERSLLKTAKGLLRHAEDPGNPEDTRKNFYVQLKKVIDKLNKDDETVIPLQITAEIEHRAQLRIENNHLYINDHAL